MIHNHGFNALCYEGSLAESTIFYGIWTVIVAVRVW